VVRFVAIVAVDVVLLWLARIEERAKAGPTVAAYPARPDGHVGAGYLASTEVPAGGIPTSANHPVTHPQHVSET
jgi:hypothetical protein